MEALLDIISVEARPDNQLILVFENGERRAFDMSEYMEEKPFNRLKNSLASSSKATVAYGTVARGGFHSAYPF